MFNKLTMEKYQELQSRICDNIQNILYSDKHKQPNELSEHWINKASLSSDLFLSTMKIISEYILK